MNRRGLFSLLLGLPFVPKAMARGSEVTISVVGGLLDERVAARIAEALKDAVNDQEWNLVTDWSGTDLPDGLSLDRSTGIVSGLPSGVRQPNVLVKLGHHGCSTSHAKDCARG